MTPAARVAAAIGILDRALAGEPLEKVLTTWARGNRFAGSGDRAAIRDLAFDAMRRRRSLAHLGGGETGRGVMLGLMRHQGEALDEIFSGVGYAPAPLTEAERGYRPAPMSEALALDCPDWLEPALRDSLGEDFAEVMARLQSRAPVFLRVNPAKGDLAEALAALTAEGIEAHPVPEVPGALEVTGNARRIVNSNAYKTGRVELQDAASQAVVLELPVRDGARVLDFCAGGGGKTLALAARADLLLWAHDADPARLRDLPVRAERAGVEVELVDLQGVAQAAPFDLVLLDVPCSGSGSWRRSPEGKWRLTSDALEQLLHTQDAILDQAADFVAKDGEMAYVTCSILRQENRARIDGFLHRHPDWRLVRDREFLPGAPGDGFYLAVLDRTASDRA
jgi:16S rRNA (cytosine967-C5)-methyltransferase